MPILTKLLELPISKEDNKNLTELIENYFATAYFSERTRDLAHRLSTRIAQYFLTKEVVLSSELYDSEYDLTGNAIATNDAYYKSIINFSIKNAIQSAYLLPIMRFFETADENNRPHQSLQELSNQLFAMSKLQQSLKNDGDDFIYLFIKKNFFKLDNEIINTGSLFLVFFSQYRHKLNRLPTAKNDTKRFIDLFNTVVNKMQKEVYSEFKKSLVVNNDDYYNFISSLENKLFFNEVSKQVCKNVFFDFLFLNPNNLLRQNDDELPHREQLAANVQFYLAAIEDQLSNWKSYPNQISRIITLLKINKQKNKDNETALKCFGEIVAIADQESQPSDFLNRRTRRRIDTDFFDVIKRFKKLCDDLNLLPQVQRRDCLRFPF